MPIFDLYNHREIAALPADAVIVLGYFDGVHIGHQALFAEAKKLARGTSPVCVWTFDLLKKDENTANELTLDFEKKRLLSNCGINYSIIENFEDFKGVDGKTFFEDCIVRRYFPKAVVCGFNFRFGKGRAYGAEDLEKMAKDIGIKCSVVPEQTESGETVSSSRIRKLIKDGMIEEANQLLGTPYSITSVIEHGVQIGRKMGVRTINQRLPQSKVCPKRGVYSCTVTFTVNGQEITYGGVCNIGYRPTVNNDSADITVETHIFDFDGEVYGDSATVKLYAMLREEKEFPDLDSLKAAISMDAAKSAEILKNIL